MRRLDRGRAAGAREGVLGFFISGHPLERYRVELELFGPRTTGARLASGEHEVTIGRVVARLKRQIRPRRATAWPSSLVEDLPHGGGARLPREKVGGSAGPVATGEGRADRRWDEARDRESGRSSSSRCAVRQARLNGRRDRDQPAARPRRRPPKGEGCASGARSPPGDCPVYPGDGRRGAGGRWRARPRRAHSACARTGATRRTRWVLGPGAPVPARTRAGGRLSGRGLMSLDRWTSRSRSSSWRRQIDELKKRAGGDAPSPRRSRRWREAGRALREEIYPSSRRWQRCRSARTRAAPTPSTTSQLLFTDFIELHGDRALRDDPAIVGGWARLERRAGDGHRPPEGPRHQGEHQPQLRHAAPGGLPQGAPADAAGREVPAARSSPSSTRRAPTPGSAPRSAASPRRSPEPARDGASCRADHRVVIGEGGSGARWPSAWPTAS